MPVNAAVGNLAGGFSRLRSARGPLRIGWRGLVVCLLLMAGSWYAGNGLYIHAKAVLAQLLMQQAWQRTLDGAESVRPWGWADTWPVARLRVPALAVDQLVLAGASGRNLAFGPAHVSGTGPLGGVGNAVISGHRDTHFDWLAELQGGEEIILQLPDGAQRNYRVERRSIHNELETGLLDDSPFPVLQLITCYPFDAIVPGGPLRFVVTAKPLDL